VPQGIHLADISIAEIISFGVLLNQIDLISVQAAEQAQIANYIEDTPEGYQSFLGERGIRLSGDPAAADRHRTGAL
jgi:ABC-type transport system involved in Fe-S cluster assembly fused permease/ATPase subunit